MRHGPVLVAIGVLALQAGALHAQPAEEDARSRVPDCGQAAGCLLSQQRVEEPCPVDPDGSACPDERATSREGDVFDNLGEDPVHLWVTFYSNRRCGCESAFYLVGGGTRKEVTRIAHGRATAFAVTIPGSAELKLVGEGWMTVQGR